MSSPRELFALGSSARHEHDREHPENVLRPIQVLRNGQFEPVDMPWPDSFGASTAVESHGCVAIASSSSVYFADHAQTGLDDVHELSAFDSTLWIANTGANEAISIPIAADGQVEDGAKTRRSFGDLYVHGNQIYKCAKGDRWVLTHHVHGRQTARRVAGRLLKSQGDGGFVSLDSNNRLPLKLSAPHSARVVRGENWVQDSGRARVVRYDADWNMISELVVGGWGRGAALSADHSTLFVGLSPLRRRYKSVVDGPSVAAPEVCAIDVESYKVVDRIPVPNVDQLNGLALFSETALRTTLASDSSAA